jgi:hypothetical protein
MHDGAYTTLAAAVRHYRNVHDALTGYDDPTRAELRTPTSTIRPADATLQTLDTWSKPLASPDAEVDDRWRSCRRSPIPPPPIWAHVLRRYRAAARRRLAPFLTVVPSAP